MSLTCDYCKKQVKRLVKLVDIPDLRKVFDRLEDHNSVCVICTKKARIVAEKIPKRVVDQMFLKKQKQREAKKLKRTKLYSINELENNKEAINVEKSPQATNKEQNPIDSARNMCGIILTNAFSISKNQFENMCNHTSPCGSCVTVKREDWPENNLNQESNEPLNPNNLVEINLNSPVKNDSYFVVEEDVKDPNILINDSIDINESTLTVILTQNRIEFSPKSNALLDRGFASKENLVTACINSAGQKNIRDNNELSPDKDKIIVVQENDHTEKNKNSPDSNLSCQTTILTNQSKNDPNNAKAHKSKSRTHKQYPEGNISTLQQNKINHDHNTVRVENKTKLNEVKSITEKQKRFSAEVDQLQENVNNCPILINDCSKQIDEFELKKNTNQEQNTPKKGKKNILTKGKSSKSMIEAVASNVTVYNKNVTSPLKEKNHEEQNNISTKKKHTHKTSPSIKRKLMNVSENIVGSFSSDEDDIRVSKKMRSIGKNYFSERSTNVWKPVRNGIQQMVETSPENVTNINKRNPNIDLSNNLTKDNLDKSAEINNYNSSHFEYRLMRYFKSTKNLDLNSLVPEQDSFNITDVTINDMDRLQENASQECEIIRKCDELVSKINSLPISNKRKPHNLSNENSSAKFDALCKNANDNAKPYHNSAVKTNSRKVNIEKKSEAYMNKDICKNNIEACDFSPDVHEISLIANSVQNERLNNKQTEIILEKENLVRNDDSDNCKKLNTQKLNNYDDEILYAEAERIESEVQKFKNDSGKSPADKVLFDLPSEDSQKESMDQNNELNEDLLESILFRSCAALPQKLVQNQYGQKMEKKATITKTGKTRKDNYKNEFENDAGNFLIDGVTADVLNTDYLNNSFLPTSKPNEVNSNKPEIIQVGHVIQNLEIPITELVNKSSDSNDTPKDLLDTINKSLEILNNISHTGIVKNISANTLNNQNINNPISYTFSLLHKEKSLNPNFVTKLSPLPEISIRRIRWSIECDAALESGVRHKCYKTLNSFAMPICSVKNCTGGNFIFNFSAVLNSGSLQIELNGQEANRIMFGLSNDIWLDVCCLLYSLGEYNYHNGKLDRTNDPLQASILDLMMKSSSRIGSLMLLYQKVKSQKGLLLRSIDASKSYDGWHNTKPLDVARFGLKSKTLELLQTSAKLHNKVVSQNKKVTMTHSDIDDLQMILDDLEKSDIEKSLLNEEIKKLKSDLKRYKKDLRKMMKDEELHKSKYS